MVPTTVQLAHCVAYICRKQETSSGFMSAKLTSWVNLHSQIPSNLHGAFASDQFISIEGDIAPNATFGAVITTPRLVRIMREEPYTRSACLHIDATYKLLWQGYPTLVTAVSDSYHKIRLVTILVTTNEDGDVFAFLPKVVQT